jgi:pilus assembly protein FimV
VTQISRPFQIALAAVALLLVIWLVALRGHSSGGGSTTSAPAAASTPAPASGSTSSASSAGASQSSPGGGSAASPGKIYHGSAPGVAGLTRAIAKARGAVKVSEQNAQQLQRESAQASSASPSSAAAGAAATASAAAPSRHAAPARRGTTGSSAAKPSTASPSKPARAKSATPAAAAATAAAPKVASAPAKQSLVESELKSGHTVIVLFSSPAGAVDAVVRGQLALLTLSRNRGIAVHYASPRELGAYGTVTRSLQILQTPTILVISPSGKTKTLTGLADAYAIRQAVTEVRKS